MPRIVVALACLLLIACAAGSINPVVTGIPAPSPTATDLTDGELEGYAPDHPYSAAEVLARMVQLNSEVKPGGEPRVPVALVNLQVAFRVAEAVWSWDGKPYERFVIGARCGRGCELSVGGVPSFDSVGDDSYRFTLGDVGVPDDFGIGDPPSLQGYPAGLESDLEGVARSVTGSQLDGLFLMESSWYPPPRDGVFMLRFDDGNEEGGPVVWVWIDYAKRTLVETLERPS